MIVMAAVLLRHPFMQLFLQYTSIMINWRNRPRVYPAIGAASHNNNEGTLHGK